MFIPSSTLALLDDEGTAARAAAPRVIPLIDNNMADLMYYFSDKNLFRRCKMHL
jgi:hypothetical protein